MTWMCQALNVSPAGHYAWCHRPVSDAQQRRDAIVAALREIHTEVKGRYGSPRMKVALEAKGFFCSVNTVAKLMRDNDIRARGPRRFVPATTDSGHGLPVAENLLDRDFDPAGPNQVWTGAISPLRAKSRETRILIQQAERESFYSGGP